MPGTVLGPTHTELNHTVLTLSISHLIVLTDTLKTIMIQYSKCNDRGIPWIFGDHSESVSIQAQSRKSFLEEVASRLMKQYEQSQEIA